MTHEELATWWIKHIPYITKKVVEEAEQIRAHGEAVLAENARLIGELDRVTVERDTARRQLAEATRGATNARSTGATSAVAPITCLVCGSVLQMDSWGHPYCPKASPEVMQWPCK